MPVTVNSVLQVLIFLTLLLLITEANGPVLDESSSGERTWLSVVCVPIERLFYRLAGINPEEEQQWWGYVIAMLIFSVAGMLLLYALSAHSNGCRSTRRAYRMLSRNLRLTPLRRLPPIPTGRTMLVRQL